VADAIHVIRRSQHIGGQGNAAEQRAGIEHERNRWHIGRILKRRGDDQIVKINDYIAETEALSND
jgi:hypothetical protein